MTSRREAGLVQACPRCRGPARDPWFQARTHLPGQYGEGVACFSGSPAQPGGKAASQGCVRDPCPLLPGIKYGL